MIILGNKELTGRHFAGKTATAIYKGLRLVWQALTHLSAWFRSEGYFRSEPW